MRPDIIGMSCLSIREPWATLIVLGLKPVENRTWWSNHRGPLLIHASRTFEKDDWVWIQNAFPIDAVKVMESLKTAKFGSGEIIGSVNMIECVRIHPSPYFFGPFGFVFENAIRFDQFIPYRGQYGIFEVKA